MNRQLVHPDTHTKLFLELSYFFSLHKWTALMFGGVFLTVPAALEALPESAGVLGFLAFAFGVWKQVRDDRRKEALHNAKMDILKSIKDGTISVEEVDLVELLKG